MNPRRLIRSLTAIWLAMVLAGQAAADIAQTPLFLVTAAAPRVMLAMSVDHQLFKKAYPDYNDLDGDGVVDITYNNNFNYDGYFASDRCYQYASGMFQPKGTTATHYCGTGEWSGNFLNWATMTRLDILRKVLYGGLRSTDSTTSTVLERAHLPSDVHAFAKVYSGTDLSKLTPYSYSEITLCNVTATLTGESQTSADPPQLRVAKGAYSLWASDERNQCLWDGEDVANTSKNPGTSANAVSSGTTNGLNVRVSVCEAGKEEANCRTYGSKTKPAGILQEYGEDGSVDFGLVSGSYGRNHEGGVLRRALGAMANSAVASENEIDGSTGIFDGSVSGIVHTLNNLRINRWNNVPGKVYNDCNTFGITQSQFLAASIGGIKHCSSWGNPVAELYLEALRYLAGESAPQYTFSGYSYETDGKQMDLPVLTSWSDPVPSSEWCAPLNVLLISSSDNSFDTDDLTGVPAELGSVADAVDAIGTTEAISGSVFAGQTTSSNGNDICDAKPFGKLSDVRGVCPTAPALEGGYHVAGLAYKAHTTDFRSDLSNTQQVNTYVVGLSKELPELVFNTGKGSVTVVPLCGANTTGSATLTASGWTPCTLADVMVRETATDGAGNLTYIRFLGVWEDSLWGNDYDHDGMSQIAVCVGPTACAAHDDDADGRTDEKYGASSTVATGQVRVTARVLGADAGNALRFGYSVSGTTADKVYNDIYRRGGKNGSVLDPKTLVPNAIRPDGYTSSEWYGPSVKVFSQGASTASLLPNPLIYAAKYGGFTDSNDNGIPDLKSEWDGDLDGLPDNYFFANNPGKLGAKLAEFLGTINTNASSASVVANAAVLDTDTRIYQAQFNSKGWFGHVYSYDISSGVVPSTYEWDAATKITAQNPSTGRNIITWRKAITAGPSSSQVTASGSGVPFRWAADQTYLNDNQKALINADGLGAKRIDWVRGAAVAGFRTRLEELSDGTKVRNVLGDIVHSTPALVGQPNYDYPDSIEPNAPYSTFKASFATTPRDTMLYVGGNDGMLHAIDATPGTTGPGGTEKLAYVPSAVLANLPNLSSPSYTHQYFVDGPPTVADAYFGTSWHTVLVAGLRGGGKGIYALDVTDPSKFSETNASSLVLWELDDTDLSGLGYTFSQPAVFKEQGSDEWVAAFGNGFGGSGAKLYIVKLSTGTLLETITLDSTAGNGLATIAPVDTDNDGLVDLIYAGDLKGSVWRVPATNTGFKKTSYSLLYAAKDPSGGAQAITTALEVGVHPFSTTGRMVFFGTGTYYQSTDNTPGSQTQTMYGIWDKDDGVTVTSVTTRNSSVLQKQEVLVTKTLSGTEVRAVSDNSLDWSTQHGWYLDLPTTGERMVSEMALRAGRLIFVTTIPSSSSCSAGGDSWLMEVNAATGGRLNINVLDINGDGTFGVGDMVDVTTTDSTGKTVTTKTPVTGRKFDAITQSPSIIRAGTGSTQNKGNVEYKFLSSSDGTIKRVVEQSAYPFGRTSWLQIK